MNSVHCIYLMLLAIGLNKLFLIPDIPDSTSSTWQLCRCQKHCWSSSLAFSHSFCPQTIFVNRGAENCCDFQFSENFDFSRNKGTNAGRFRKNAGMREERRNEGFPARLRDG